MLIEVVTLPLSTSTCRQKLRRIVCKEITSHTCASVLFGFLNTVMKEICSDCDHKLRSFVLIALIFLLHFEILPLLSR